MKKYYYFGGTFLSILIGLFFLYQYLILPDVSIQKNSSLWHFKYNKGFHRMYSGSYVFDEKPKTLFDIDIHDLDMIGGGAIDLGDDKVCNVLIHNIQNVDKKRLDTILNRIRGSSLSKNLKEEHIIDDKTETIYFSSLESEILIDVYRSDNQVMINFRNINNGCINKYNDS